MAWVASLRRRQTRAFAVALFLVLNLRDVAMADWNAPMSAERFSAFLDENYPVLAPGAVPPGRWIPDPKGGAGRNWQGTSGWRTRHGQAVIRWDLGRPIAASNALLPGGERGDVSSTLDHGLRRRSHGPRRWIYGTIDIRSDDVVFTDNDVQPSYEAPIGDDANFERDLAHDHAFLDDLKDDHFAFTVYRVMMNRAFVRASDLALWTCGDRQAARLVAGLRDFGESYQDFFLRYEEGDVWPEDQEESLTFLANIAERSAHGVVDFRLPVGTNYGGTVIETEAQAEAIAEERRVAFEVTRAQRELVFEQRKGELEAFRKRPMPEAMRRLRTHLDRLGWRVANDNDNRRMAADAMRAGLALLGEIRELEKRPGAGAEPPKKIVEGLRMARLVRRFDQASPDEREVLRGLRYRIEALAASGRVSEDERHVLLDRAWAVDARVGWYDPT